MQAIGHGRRFARAASATIRPEAAEGGEVAVCTRISFKHKRVNRNVGKYVAKRAYINGMVSWALMNFGYRETFHHLSEMHLDRCVGKFAGRRRIRDYDAIARMPTLARGMVGNGSIAITWSAR